MKSRHRTGLGAVASLLLLLAAQPSASGQCDDSCASAGDGVCDEREADDGLCAAGTDCSDCRGASVAIERLCSDTCGTSRDGECDDGADDADYEICIFGTDCSDCGPRDAPAATVGAWSVQLRAGVGSGSPGLYVRGVGSSGAEPSGVLPAGTVVVPVTSTTMTRVVLLEEATFVADGAWHALSAATATLDPSLATPHSERWYAVDAEADADSSRVAAVVRAAEGVCVEWTRLAVWAVARPNDPLPGIDDLDEAVLDALRCIVCSAGIDTDALESLDEPSCDAPCEASLSCPEAP